MRNRSFTASCVAILFMSETFFAGLVVTTLFVGGKAFAHSRTAPEEA